MAGIGSESKSGGEHRVAGSSGPNWRTPSIAFLSYVRNQSLRFAVDLPKEPRSSVLVRTEMAAMEHDEPIVAVGLLTQTNLRMLGGSLKVVFPVEENSTEFDELLRALDRIDKSRA